MANEAHQFMEDMIDYAKRFEILLKYAPTRVYQMLQKYGQQYGSERGAVETARELIKKPNTSGDADLTLHVEAGLKFSIEWLVVQPQYAPLFTPDERALARKTLTDHGLRPDQLPAYGSA